jgi:hypothetical protein
LTLDEVTDSRPRSESGGPARAYYSAIGFALNHVITVDDDRLARACEHVSAVDVLGTTDDYCAALAVLESRFGWVIRSVPRRNAGRAPEVSESFRRRIAADNAYDTALYEYARARRSRP